MSSSALTGWQTGGLRRLAELETVHAQAKGLARGRRWGTTQLNRSLFVALLGQFQGFCRDLHDEAIGVHVGLASPGQGRMLQALLTQGRKLETGNPRTSVLGADFGRLGFSFIPDLKARGAATVANLEALDRLVDFRNAVVHGKEFESAALETAGAIRSTKTSYVAHRRSLEALAITMDSEVATQLSSALGVAKPW